MKLLPFDLEKAQAGHPWGTRDGRKGKKIFDTERDGINRLIAIFEDGSQESFTVKGYSPPMRYESIYLYEEPKKGWVVIYRDETNSFGFSAIRCGDENEKETHENITKARGAHLKTVEIEY